jgi:hypothetical protein
METQMDNRPEPIILAFLSGADAVLTALSSDAVAQAWEKQSVLDGQKVSGLAGHLARGAVWAVGDYLAAGQPTGEVTFESAAAYCAAIAERLTPSDHEAIRRRGAEIGSLGHRRLAEDLDRRLSELGPLLRASNANQPIAVIGGEVMRLADYLETRIVEQVVHLDDLARSVGARPWPVPPECMQVAISVGTEIGRRRFGDAEMIRALYRNDASSVLPVL